ncbi:MAG: cyclic nucleotide-binding domain-containing protein [Magnetococcales bacterium]|nr:cyclic nucleotide-binding domain-containing protein [Magnetococcales bacterium]MBF0148897.1 cyclic nucleotide-binding domain-containing protein [Magnetococcales bacterium]MBF0347345.1 cyclic nucleotide-binding domain-containing protein [Magnetococcales bacterium]MBF0630098.1 cyclic nucleotide-binding domain-containing protein [Magnetococcales bacterium]
MQPLSNHSSDEPEGERDLSCAFGFLLLSLLVFLIEMGFLWGMFWEFGTNPMKTPVVLMGLHAGLVVSLFLLAWLRGRKNHPPCLNGFFFLLPLAVGMLGFIGILGILLSLGLFLEYRKTATSFEEWYASLFPEDSVNAAMELMERLESRGEETHAALTPFMDLLAYGSQEQKQTMIARMSRHFKPAFAPVLREAVNNPDNSVRVQAATAISHVENRFMKDTMKLEQQRASHDRDWSFLLKVARHYDDFAFTGLLDPVREGENRQKAIAGYRACLAVRPDDHEVQTALGRTLVRSGALEEAAEFFDAILRQGQTSHRMVLWSMETLYKLQRFAQLTELAGRYQHLFSGDEEGMARIRETVDLWSGRYTGDGLHKVTIFALLSVAERSALVRDARLLEFTEGSVIVRQGDMDHTLYVILSGMVVVSLNDAAQGTVELARLGEGQYFGEMSLLTGAKRASNVLALTEKCRLMEISSMHIVPIIRGKEEILNALALDIAKRQSKLEAGSQSPFFEVDSEAVARRAAGIREQIDAHLARL